MTRRPSSPGPELKDECAVAVAQWIGTARREVEEFGFSQIDLDGLFSTRPLEAVAAAVACI